MKKLIAALVAGMFAAATLTAFAADAVKAGGSTDKPGRAVDEGKDSVKSGGSADKPGRAADDSKAVKSGGVSDKPSRAADTDKKSSKKKKKHAQTEPKS